MKRKPALRRLVSASMVALASTNLMAETWLGTTTDYNDINNWSPASVPNSASASALFNAKDITGTESVVVNSAVTVNSMNFNDTNLADGTYAVTGTGITLGGTTPTITVGAGLSGPVSIANVLSGSAGLTKSGAGTLTLTGTNTVTGGIAVNGGTLDTTAAFTVLNTRQFVTLSGGGTWKFTGSTTAGAGWGLTNSTGQPPGFLGSAGGVFVAAGQTGTVQSANNTALGQVGGGAGSTLNVIIQTGTTFQARGTWQCTTTANSGGQLGNLNISASSGSATFDLGMNVSGNTDRFLTSTATSVAFQNTAVSVGAGVTWLVRTPSSGGSISIGSLSGAAGSTFFGGRSSGGAETNYTIGSLGTNTTFSGTIKCEANDTPTANGAINITKVGAGTLTLNGSLIYIPTANATFARKGGKMDIQAGTVALGNAATIASGSATSGPTSVIIGAAGTLDVSGTTNTFVDGTSATVTGYSTNAFSQYIGSGTVVGNFNLAAGNLAPGNTMGSSVASPNNAVAGTMTFTNKLNFMGTGTINFDISSTSTSDLLQVANADLSGTPTLKITAPPSAPGTFTIINSTNNLTGSAAGWVVNWTGRGATPTLDWTTDPKKLQMTVSAIGANINWSGAGGATWDINTTASWFNTAPSFTNPDKYFEADAVSLLDTYDGVNAPSSTAITLNSTVQPNTVTVNSSLNYSISGTGKISGTASLVKSGTGSLTLSTANDYSGTTTINGGSVTGAIGTGALTMSGGSLTTNNNVTIPATTITAATSNTITTTGSGTTTQGSLSGSGTLTYTQAAGTLDVTNNNSGFSGTLILNGTASVRFGNGAASAGSIHVQLNSGNLQTNAPSTGSTDIGELSGTGGILTGFQGGNTPANGTVRTWNIGGLNTSTTFAGQITNGKAPSITAINKTGTGTLTLNGFASYTGATTVTNGTLVVGSTGFLGTAPDANSVLNVSSGANLQIDSGGTANFYSISASAGTLTVNGSLTTTGAATSNVGRFTGTGSITTTAGNLVMATHSAPLSVASDIGSITFGVGTKLDITNNAVQYHSTDTSDGTRNARWAEVVTGMNNFDNNGQVTWDGPGIVSSTARTSNVGLGVDAFVVGVVSNHDLAKLSADGGAALPYDSGNPWLGTVSGVGADDILVRMTYAGDTNLDGTITIDDYNNIDGTFSGLLPSNYGWVSGDFDFNGAITIDDYNAIDSGFLYQGGQLTQGMIAARTAMFGADYVAHLEAVAAAFASVPEPTTVGVLAIGAFGLASRRRRKH